jgi:hypothetical protein
MDEIPDALLKDLRRRAAREQTTLRAIINTALRKYLSDQPKSDFVLKDGSVDGQGTLPGVREGDWQEVRRLVYDGRGG